MTPWPAVVVLVGTAAAMPLVRRELVRRELLDHPNLRSSHDVPTPRGGGIGVLAGLVLGGLAAGLGGAAGATGAVAVVGGAALVLGLVGWVDDVRGLSALSRLAGQLLVGAGVGVGVGAVVFAGSTPIRYAALGALALPVAVNAVNFMDGINGITGATMAVWGGTAGYAGWRHGQPEVALLGLSTAAAALGFLPYNVPVARLFLGDVGSYAFGGLVGGTSVLALARGVPWPLLLAPVLPYLVDVTLTLVRRARRHAPLLSAHREHVYQLLSSRPGGSQVRVTVAMAALAAVSSVLVAVLTASSDGAVDATAGWGTAGLAGLLALGFGLAAARWGPSAGGPRR